MDPRELDGIHGCVVRSFDTRDVGPRARQGDDFPLGRAVRRDRGVLIEPLARAGGVVVADVLGTTRWKCRSSGTRRVVKAFAT